MLNTTVDLPRIIHDTNVFAVAIPPTSAAAAAAPLLFAPHVLLCGFKV